MGDTRTGKYLTPHANASACVFIYISILFPFIAPPLSSTVYTLPFISSFVPNEYWLEAATVRPAVALVPDAVIPVCFPQHLEHGQYAVILNIFVSPVATIVDPDLDVVMFLWIWTILSTGCFIICSDNFIFSISTLFWYLTL